MSRQTTFPKYDLLGVEVDALTIAQSIDYVVAAAKNPTASCYVVKPYVEFLDTAANDQSIRVLLNDAQLCLPDGIALVWAAHYKYAGRHTWPRLISTLIAIATRPRSIYSPLPARFGGTDFTWPLLERAAAEGLSVFLIGSPKHNSIEQTARYLAKHINGLRIAGTFTGRFDEAGRAQLMDILGSSKPNIILVGTGFPRQERFMAAASAELQNGVFIGEGGTFDYQSFGGRTRKAPLWMQKLGLEWLWRLILEPGRIGRQLAIPRFVRRIYRDR
jgi:N-acetylglucosaminyldiphosphoundecaprenol N-acetyl-beta-D-mannosaminyltransferase